MEKPQDLKSESCATRSLGRDYGVISHFVLPDEARVPAGNAARYAADAAIKGFEQFLRMNGFRNVSIHSRRQAPLAISRRGVGRQGENGKMPSRDAETP